MRPHDPEGRARIDFVLKKRPKDHFVTQSYLRGFATGAGRKSMLYVYERNNPKPFRQKPQQAARQTNYYSFTKADGTVDDSIESLLGMVESRAIPVLKKLASDDLQLNWEARDQISLFVAFQELRVPSARENYQNLLGQLVKRISEISASVPGLLESDIRELESKGESFKELTADSLRESLKRGEYTFKAGQKTSLLAMLTLAPRLHALYREMEWRVIRTPATSPFVTSDNPVVKFDPQHRSGFWGIGMASPTIEIRFPVSKSTFLVFTHDKDRQDTWLKLMDAGKQAEADALRQTLPKITYHKATPNAVQQINGLAIDYATRFVYSSVRNPQIPLIMKGEPGGVRFKVS